jgi:hypothetical protein
MEWGITEQGLRWITDVIFGSHNLLGYSQLFKTIFLNCWPKLGMLDLGQT